MSNAATAAFLAAWRSTQRKPVGLCKIVLTSPATTLRFATTEVVTAGTSWEAGFSCEPIRDQVEFLGPGPNPVTVTFALADRAYAFGGGSKLSAAMASNVFDGAAVTLYLWEQSLTSFGDALQVFDGIIDTISTGLGVVTFTAVQQRSWNKAIPSKKVDKTNAPNAPDVSQGIPYPIVYGDHSARALRSPALGLGLERKHEYVGGADGAVPLVMLDPGVGAAKVKLIAAGHAISDLDNSTDCSVKFVGERSLAVVDSAAGFTETLSPEALAEIDDDSLVLFYPIIPIEPRAGSNTALNPRRAVDIADEQSYATLDQSLGQNKLELYLPNPAASGYIQSVSVYACVSGDAANTQQFRIYPRDNGGATGTSVTGSSTSASPSVISGTWDGAWWTRQWDFGIVSSGFTVGGAGQPGAVGNTISVCVDFAGAVATNKGRVYWIALVAKVKPSRNVVTPGVSQVRMLARFGAMVPPLWGYFNADTGALEAAAFSRSTRPRSAVPTVYNLDGQFYANLKGYADDGSGTYTGTASALIQRPCDIVRHLLAVYGAASQFETGATAHGSFVLARGELRNGGAADFKMAPHIGEVTSVQGVAQRVCQQALATFWLDPFDGKWRFATWKRGAQADYDIELLWDHLFSIATSKDTNADVRQEIRVGYDYDYYKGRTSWEAYVGPDGSSQGYNLPTTRDQVLTVVTGSNDKLDWQGAGTYAATLAAGTYAPIDLAVEAQAKMRAAGAGIEIVQYGLTIKTGFNDAIDFDESAGALLAIIPAGAYTPESFCIAAAAAMTDASHGGAVYSWAYDHATNKFTITSVGNAFRLFPQTGATVATSALWVAGFSVDTLAANTKTAAEVTYHEHFGIRRMNKMLWLTGANTATNAAYLMGYEKLDSGVVVTNFGAYARGAREALAAASIAAYGAQEPGRVTAEWIRDEASAVNLRDRSFDMLSEPPRRVSLVTHVMPDIRRMQTFKVSSDVDAHVGNPRGSWGGRVLRCLERSQNMGTPNFLTEVVAVEV